MAKINHNISAPNDGLGDQLRTAFGNQNAMNTELYDTKVEKVLGKGLTENEFTDAEKTKLAGIAADAEKNVQADWAQNDNTADDYIKNKPLDLVSYEYNAFKFIQKGFGNTDLTTNEIGDIFCGWKNDGTIRYSEAKYLGGALNDSGNFLPLVQTEI